MWRGGLRTFAAAIAIAIVACGGPSRFTAPAGAQPTIGDDWFEQRARELSITLESAKARDAAFSEAEPPDEDSIDPTVRAQAAAIWTSLCARCHGANGDLEGAEQFNPPPRKWGTMGVSMGFFFGGDSMRAGIYRKIAEGGEPREGVVSAMPPWREVLAKEQIWALVQHIERF